MIYSKFNGNFHNYVKKYALKSVYNISQITLFERDITLLLSMLIVVGDGWGLWFFNTRGIDPHSYKWRNSSVGQDITKFEKIPMPESLQYLFIFNKK